MNAPDSAVISPVSTPAPAAKRGFAAMSPERLREIASAGGVARREAYKLARRNPLSRAPAQTLHSSAAHFASSPA